MSGAASEEGGLPNIVYWYQAGSESLWVVISSKVTIENIFAQALEGLGGAFFLHSLAYMHFSLH
eukprot:6032230-Ditylum_brightwellii.AAC.1